MIFSVEDDSIIKGYNLPTDGRHLNFIWSDGESNIAFSAMRADDFLSCHIAAKDRIAKAKLRKMINECCPVLFSAFGWAEAVIARTTKPSVRNLCLKCGFEDFLTEKSDNKEDVRIMIRWRDG